MFSNFFESNRAYLETIIDRIHRIFGYSGPQKVTSNSHHQRRNTHGRSERKSFSKIRRATRDLSLDRNSTREITRKLDHFAGSFSSGPRKSIPVDSIIATRSSEGIAGISVGIRGCARVKDKINKTESEKPPPRKETASYFLAVRWSSCRLMYPGTQVVEWGIRPSMGAEELSTILGAGYGRYSRESEQSSWRRDGSALRSLALSDEIEALATLVLSRYIVRIYIAFSSKSYRCPGRAPVAVTMRASCVKITRQEYSFKTIIRALFVRSLLFENTDTAW